MFGRIVEVLLRNGKGEKKVFRFNERNQESGGETARISFYTDHKYLSDAIQTANIDLYNLDDSVLDWIWHSGGAFVAGENPTLTSNLHVELSVGYSNFKDDNPQMWKIFVGTANSYFNSRKGRDNITHLFCGNMPFKDITRNVITSTKNDNNNTTRYHLLSVNFMALLANRGILQMWVPSLQKVFRNITEENMAIWSAWASGDFKIRILNPLYENNGSSLGLSSQTSSELSLTGSSYNNELSLTNSPEYQAYKDWLWSAAGSDPQLMLGNFEQWLRDFCRNEGAMYIGYNPKTSDLFSPQPVFTLEIMTNHIPESLIKRKAEEQMMLGVPAKNIIRNYEMLLEEPTLTSLGVEIKSLMRPWLDAEDVIKLAVDKNPIINGEARSDLIWTANVQGADNLYQSAWGNDTAIYAALRQRANKLSFMNVPLVVFEVQHSGDTHKKDWYSQINTYAPGMAFKRNR